MLLLLVNTGKWYPHFQNSSWPKQGHTSAVFSVLISIFPSKGPHVVPTGSCCRLWIRRSPSLRNASSSPKTQQSPKKSATVLYIAHKFHIKSQWHSFIVLSPQTCMRIKAPQWRLKPSSFKMDKQIEQAAIWWCSSDTCRANLTWEVSCVEIISVRQCRLTGWWEQLVAGLFLLFQEGWALVSTVQSSS